MTTEQLLMPRYKVIADYPKSEIPVGTIMIMDGEGVWCASKTYVHLLSSYYYLDVLKIKEYPHLFKELEWWEQRKIEDMPDYIKVGKYREYNPIGKRGVYKVTWESNTHVGFKGGQSVLYGLNSLQGPIEFLPATEQEYIDYVNSKQITHEHEGRKYLLIPIREGAYGIEVFNFNKDNIPVLDYLYDINDGEWVNEVDFDIAQYCCSKGHRHIYIINNQCNADPGLLDLRLSY